MPMALLNLSSLGLAPPLITLNGASSDDIVKALDNIILGRAEKNVLAAIKSVSRESETKYINVAALSLYMKKSESVIRKSLKDLVKKGIFDELYCQAHPTVVRRSSLFSFKIGDSATSTENQYSLSFESAPKLPEISMNEADLYGRADDFICRFLFAALPYSRKSVERESHSLIYINKEPTRVFAKTDSEKLARLRDLRYYVSLLKNCETQIKLRAKAVALGALSPEDLKNTLFDLHETDILNSAGIDLGSGERSNLKQAMVRLDGTSYYIENPSIEMMKLYGLEERRVKITHFDLVDYFKNDQGRRSYRIELPQRIVEGILNATRNGVDAFYKIEPRIFKETQPLKFALILWASHLPSGKTFKYNWQALKDFIYPKQSMRFFKKEFLSIMKQHQVEEVVDYDGEPKRGTDGRVLASAIYKKNSDELLYCHSTVYGLNIDYNNINEAGEFIVNKPVSSEHIKALMLNPVRRGSRRTAIAPPTKK